MKEESANCKSGDAKWNNMVSLGWDVIYCANGIQTNMHTHEYVGINFNSLKTNTLLTELDSISDKDNKPKKKESFCAKQILICMATTWALNIKKIKRVVATYAVGDGLLSSFLVNEVPKIITALSRYSCIIINVTGDGATENRSTFKALGKITFEDVLREHLSDEQKGKYPLKQIIAFPHPIRSTILIFIGGEMPNLGKKIVNAFERSGLVHTTDLKFREKHMSLTMLQNCWDADGGGSLPSDLQTNLLIPDHFPPKNAYSCMRVHLEVLVMIQSAITLLKDICDVLGGMYEVEPMIAIIEKIDRMINIWNNTSMGSRKVWKGCEMINSPTHFHIEELFEILDVFCEWKEEANNNTKELIPWQSFEDIVWLVSGIVGISKTYLKEDGTRIMVQRNGGTDCCKN